MSDNVPAKLLGHPNKLFRFPSPDRTTFFKAPFKGKHNRLIFMEISVKIEKVFNLKELYLKLFIYLFIFYLTDRPNLSRWRAMGNETFYWDGLTVLPWQYMMNQHYIFCKIDANSNKLFVLLEPHSSFRFQYRLLTMTTFF